MKGVIFKLLEDFVVTNFGPDAFEDLVDGSELETKEPFVGPGTYPAGDLMALVGTAVAAYDMEVDELLRAFGRHAFAGLAGAVPSLLEGLDDPHSLLLNLESVVHTEVRKLDPDADPARFTAVEIGPSELMLTYESPFGLFALVEGLLDGVGMWFGIPIEHERVSTEGTNGTFRVLSGEAVSGPAAQATDSALA